MERYRQPKVTRGVHDDAARKRQSARRRGIDWSYDEPDLTNTAELYDPATASGVSPVVSAFPVPLIRLRCYPTARSYSQAAVATGREFATNTAELYDPATGKWSLTGNLSRTRVGHDCDAASRWEGSRGGRVLDDGVLLALGSAEVYDPNTETWSITGSLNTPRAITPSRRCQTATSCCVGKATIPFTLNSAELYDPATGRWSDTGSLLKRRSGGQQSRCCPAARYWSREGGLPGNVHGVQ